MNNNNTTDDASTESNPLEPRLDALLTSFFQHEMPAQLGMGQLNWADVESAAGGTPQRVTVAPLVSVTSPAVLNSRPQRRLAVAIGLSTLAATLMVVAQFRTSQPTTGPVVDQSLSQPVDSQPSDLMLVSPHGDQPQSADTVVGDHGLTIGETDDINLNPETPRKP